MWHPPLSRPAFSHYQQCWILGEPRESSRGHLAFAGLENAELGEGACWEDGVLSFQTRCKAVTGALVCEWRLMLKTMFWFCHIVRIAVVAHFEWCKNCATMSTKDAGNTLCRTWTH